MSQFDQRDGYYDDYGYWRRTKFCFMSCGDRCTCMPPFNMHYNPAFDKTKKPKEEEDKLK